MWGSISVTAEATRDLVVKSQKPAKKKAKTESAAKRKTSNNNKKKDSDDQLETFHFIGYVPAHGKVWELDGLKSGPLEVGELPNPGSTTGWENIVRPALRLKMQKYGAFGGEDFESSENIQFNLLALVQDRYEVNLPIVQNTVRLM